jgi:cytochrome c oxidase subunit 2
MSWILPSNASTFAGDIDFLYYLVLVITGIAFVVVEAGLVWFVIKYRARPDRKAHYTHGSMKAEIVWTAIPAVTVVVIGIMSGAVWENVKGRNSVPPDAIPYRVNVRQFEWEFTYRGPDGQLGTADDFTLRNQLHIPVSQPVVMNLHAEDVIHSFFIPAFRVKQDAVPGMAIRVWFEATQVGEYELACAELCGLGHYRMRATVTVHSAADYQQWLADQAVAADEE